MPAFKVLLHFLCSTVLLLYIVPSFMYCLYNNLAFVNLANYDPTTYYLLLQFRVVVTGVIFQVWSYGVNTCIIITKKIGLRWPAAISGSGGVLF